MDPADSTPPPLPTPVAEGLLFRQLAVWPIFRDVLIVFLCTAAGGFFIGVAKGVGLVPAQSYMLWLGASNLVFGTLAFAICGVRAPGRRWLHLAFVAFGSWIAGLVNVLFLGLTVAQWAAGIVFIALIMGLGGAVSFLFRAPRS